MREKIFVNLDVGPLVTILISCLAPTVGRNEVDQSCVGVEEFTSLRSPGHTLIFLEKNRASKVPEIKETSWFIFGETAQDPSFTFSIFDQSKQCLIYINTFLMISST